MDQLTIGQMAKLNGISEQTLRLYDKMGLLKPYSINQQNQYRFYSIKQNARLDMIQHMKSLGMNLKDIKKLLDQKDLSLIKQILHQKNEQIEETLKVLKYQKQAIERTIMSYDKYEMAPPDGSIVLEYLPKRFMYCIDMGVNFYDYNIETYEELLSQAKSTLVSNHLPAIYFCNAGTILREKDVKARKFYSTEVFVFVDEADVPLELVATIPSHTYLCIYCNQFEKEKQYANRLLDTVEEKGYRIVGDYICEVITDLPLFEGIERNMFLRLQVPVKFS